VCVRERERESTGRSPTTCNCTISMLEPTLYCLGKGDNVASKNHEMEKIKREEEDDGRGRA